MTLFKFNRKAEAVVEALLPFWFFFTLFFTLRNGFTGYMKWLTLIVVAILVLFIIRNVIEAKGFFEKCFQIFYPIAVIAGMTYLLLNFK